jgi:hypothetical protein
MRGRVRVVFLHRFRLCTTEDLGFISALVGWSAVWLIIVIVLTFGVGSDDWLIYEAFLSNK